MTKNALVIPKGHLFEVVQAHYDTEEIDGETITYPNPHYELRCIDEPALKLKGHVHDVDLVWEGPVVKVFAGEMIGDGDDQQQWASICSAHRTVSQDCSLCVAGSYSNVLIHEVTSAWYERDPKAWQIWANSPKQLERFQEEMQDHFPHLLHLFE